MKYIIGIWMLLSAIRLVGVTAEELREYDVLYAEGRAAISDEEYDQKVAEWELRTGEEWVSAEGLRSAGGALGEHGIIMGSLEKAWSVEGLDVFVKRTLRVAGGGQARVYMEPKLDGMALNLKYENGKLIQVLTRGDGKWGRELQHLTERVKGIPDELASDFPAELEIRGELVVHLDEFELINEWLKERGQSIYAHPRNLVTGWAGRMKEELSEVGALSFVAFDWGLWRGREATLPADYSEFRSLLNHWGFDTPEPAVELDLSEDWEASVDAVLSDEGCLDYATDGWVLKVADCKIRTQLGRNGNSPAWAVALKHRNDRAVTLLLDIEWQVGASGRLTPVGVLSPVMLEGAVVARVNLHHAKFIDELDLVPGDSVEVQRSGAVIPRILRVTERPTSDGEGTVRNKYQALDVLEGLGLAAVECEPGSPHLCLQDYGHPEWVLQRWMHFFGREGLAVRGLGEATVRLLREAGAVNSIVGFWDLKAEDLQALNGFGGKRAEALIDALQAARDQPLERWLRALAIPGVGTKTAERLGAALGSLEDLLHLEPSDPAHPLIQVWLSYPGNAELLLNLKDIWAITVE